MSRNILSVIIGAFFLCFSALNNKFPLLTGDSGGYINAGYTKIVPFDRTVMYGLFVAYSSWGISLWLVIFCQALIFSFVLFYYFRYFCRNTAFIVPYLACLFFLAFMMSASVTTSCIGPAIFANTSILCIGLLLFAENLKRRDLYIISILTVMSIGMDVAYLVISAILLILAGLMLLFRKKEQIPGTLRTSIRRLAVTGTLVTAGWLLVPAIQYGLGGGFAIVRDSNINTFSQIKAQRAIDASFYQLSNIKVGKYDRQSKDSTGYNAMYKWYKHEVRACYIISCQMNDWLNFNPLNYCQIISAILCACIFIPVLMNKIISRHRNLFTYILLAFFIHAFVNAVLYGKNNDLQSHVVWLLPIPIFVYLSEAAIVSRWKLTIENVLKPR
jgi:hypothetical protein